MNSAKENNETKNVAEVNGVVKVSEVDVGKEDPAKRK